MSGAIDILEHTIIVQEDKMLNANATISFLRKIEEAYPTKKRIHLFCDNAQTLKSRIRDKFSPIECTDEAFA